MLISRENSPRGRTEKQAGRRSQDEAQGRFAQWGDFLRRSAGDVLLLAKLVPLLLPALIFLAQFSQSLVLAAAVFMVITGLLHGRRTTCRWHSSRRPDRQMRKLLRSNRRFSRRLAGAGAILAALGLIVESPAIVAALGVVLSVWILGGGYRLRFGKIGTKLTCTLLMVAIAGLGFAGILLAEVVSKRREPSGVAKAQPRPPWPNPPGGSATLPTDPPPTYAENCPELPDPMTIDHDLGKLFKKDGAAQAGCGQPAEAVVGMNSVWFSQGTCAGDLRSLAVVAEDHPAVLLYGEPARFALEAARAGELLYAEVAEPGGGDLNIIGTQEGSFVFVRSSPILQAGTGKALRCTEVDEVAHPFSRLAPPLAELWHGQMNRTGWAWPIQAAASSYGTLAFLDYRTDVVVATGSCMNDSSCRLDGPDGHSTIAGPTIVSLDDLEPYMAELQ